MADNQQTGALVRLSPAQVELMTEALGFLAEEGCASDAEQCAAIDELAAMISEPAPDFVAFNAACLWEVFLGLKDNPEALGHEEARGFLGARGSCEAREEIAGLAMEAESAWDSLSDDDRDGWACPFDWGFIPHWLPRRLGFVEGDPCQPPEGEAEREAAAWARGAGLSVEDRGSAPPILSRYLAGGYVWATSSDGGEATLSDWLVCAYVGPVDAERLPVWQAEGGRCGDFAGALREAVARVELASREGEGV
jgi:hypothetical protein